VRQEEGVSGQRMVYDGFGFDEVRSLALDEDGEVDRTTGRKHGGSPSGGKYRYEGTGSNVNGSKGEKYEATRNSIYVNAIPAAYKTADGVFYSGADRLGSTEMVTDEEGQLFESYEYDAFGGLISGDPEKGFGKLYAGKSYDPATKTYDYGFRDYLPSLARFTTVDPIRDGANWYSYCDADPVNHVDLWGLSASDKSYNTGVTSFNYSQNPGYVLVEGVGVFGSWNVNGYVDISENSNGTYTATITALASSLGAENAGDVTYFGKVNIVSDGKVVASSPLIEPSGAYYSSTDYSMIGSAEILLPSQEENIEFKVMLETGYTIDMAEGPYNVGTKSHEVPVFGSNHD
jgi:RHS repeat-associated protein